MRILSRGCLAAFILLTIGSVWVYTQTQNTVPKYGSSGTLVNSSITETGGRVGIGTANPERPLHIHTSNDNEAIKFSGQSTGATTTDGVYFGVAGTVDFQLWQYENGYFRIGTNNNERLRIDPAGNVGVGTAAPAAKLHVAGNVVVDGNIGAKYQDVAEWVESDAPIEPGTVVVIDESGRNKVTAASTSYDSRIAGAVSAQPGLLLGEAGAGKIMVAQSGRVRIKVDATYGAIRAGDLLVSSPTKGHAMRSRPLRVGGEAIHRPGTVLGKALEALPSGRGEILALLTLQ